MKLTKLLISALLGLGIAVLNCGLGTMVNASAFFYNSYLPTFCMCSYYFLCLFLFLVPEYRRMKDLWGPIICGAIDAISGLGIMYGYTLTSQASVTLLTSLSTPFAVFFSYLILKHRFSVAEVVLAILAVALAAGFAGTDYSGTKWLGCLLGALSGVGYGLGATLNERYAKNMPVGEFLAKMGISGFLINLIITLSTEMKMYSSMAWEGWVLQAFWAIGLFVWYWMAVYTLHICNAVYLNLCIIGTNIFTFPVSVLLFKYEFFWWQILLAVVLLICLAAFAIVEDRRFTREAQLASETAKPEESESKLDDGHIEEGIESAQQCENDVLDTEKIVADE